MTAIRRWIATAGSMLALAGLTAVPAVAAAAERTVAPVLGYDLADYVPPAEPVAETAAAYAAPADAAELRCLAKVVHHEAGNQPRAGQVAVAQTLINRRKQGGRFGGTICAVANQPGQYFNTAAYHPDEDSDGWHAALDVAQQTLAGTAPQSAAPGALFFRAAYVAPTSFFRTRQRIAAVGDHIFYR